MKILLLAPHPFYQDRGTPIAVDLLISALAEQGHRVDVLTYHEGEDRDYGDAVRIVRIRRPPGCRRIRPGFSLKKVVSDLYMHRAAMRMVRDGRYDVVHAVEEAVFIARMIQKRHGIPYVFDMDSSMPVQMADALPVFRLALPLMKRIEAVAIRQACVVTAVCDALADIARAAGARKIVLLRDVPLLDEAGTNSDSPGLPCDRSSAGCVFLYIGNLEAYQGMDLLLRAFARIGAEEQATLYIVGGVPKHVEKYQRLAEELRIGARTHFLGPRPIQAMGRLMQDADVLVSPRTRGQNTPMKIYSYMASGRVILATDLPTHTQVLTPRTAALAAPEPEPFANAMRELIQDDMRRQSLAAEAQAVVQKEYSLTAFKAAVAELYHAVEEARRVATGCSG